MPQHTAISRHLARLQYPRCLPLYHRDRHERLRGDARLPLLRNGAARPLYCLRPAIAPDIRIVIQEAWEFLLWLSSVWTYKPQQLLETYRAEAENSRELRII